MGTDPDDPTIPTLRIAVEPRMQMQTVMPVGFVGILAGESCEVVAEPHTIRIESFIVTDAMRDADKVRFAYQAQLAEENRTLLARVKHLETQLLATAKGYHQEPQPEPQPQSRPEPENVFDHPIELPDAPSSADFLGPPLVDPKAEPDSKG